MAAFGEWDLYIPSNLDQLLSRPSCTHLIIRRFVIVVVNRLVSASTRRLVRIVAKIDVHMLPGADKPRTWIWAGYVGGAPLQVVASELESSIGVLLGCKTDRKGRIVDAPRRGDCRIKQLHGFARCGDQLHKLPVLDLKLTCCRVVAEKCSPGGIEWLGLHVFVVVGGCDCANPVVAALERFARAGTGRCACRGWSPLCGRGFRHRISGHGAWLALRVILAMEELEVKADKEVVGMCADLMTMQADPVAH
jgi:hypothetical protein